ncbi:MAG: hypothetical protein LBQ30_07375 [Treponema sp.]|jgi:hypothetical protein|nr:hypothetical protein [Treponema sp.]
MKLRFKFAFCAVLALLITGVVFAADPKLGQPTPLQLSLNQMSEITVAGKSVKFEFGGDTWIAKVGGTEFLAGTFVSEDTEDGSILTLKQTHIYFDRPKPIGRGVIGWVATPGPDIVLEYKKGPPETFALKQ